MNFQHRTGSHSRRQRGVALLVALFALMLLSAIGLGMMYSSDTETSINFNYKDKQAAIYAANSGMEEIKDRLLQSGGDIVPPSNIPSLSAKNIIYYVNPGAGESMSSIAPWSTSGAYPDTELCQENVLGLTGTNGVPCTTLPSGSNWYQAVDNSGHWGGTLGTPISYKWVRIQLKTNNSTPFPVDGNSANGGEVCWDGLHQIPLPSGYGTSCIPVGGVTLNLTNGGSGYPVTPDPTVTIAAPASGTQATATPIMGPVTAGGVTSLTVVTAGSGYDATAPPTVTIDPPTSGTQATATANVIAAGGSLTGVSSVTPNTGCYTSLSPITVSGGVTSGKITIPLTTTQCVASISFPSPGKKCSGGTMTITGGTTSATVTGLTYNSQGAITGYTTLNPGAGYTSQPGSTAFSGVSCTGGGSASPSIQVTMGYQLQSTGATVTQSGSGYTSSSYTVPITGNASGTQGSAVVTATSVNPNAGQISGYTITNPGSGYTTLPNVTIAPPVSGTTATAAPVLSASRKITGFTMTSSGSGYTSAPSVTITPPGGAGTTATANAVVTSGPYYSPVIMLTALGQTARGGRSFTQMEAAYSIRSLSLPGALTMAGPSPSYGSPNSNNFYISGIDHPNGVDANGNAGSGTFTPSSCSTTATASHPSVGVFDNPNNPTTPSAVDQMLAPGVLLPDGTHYPGVGGSPDVQNVYGALGLTTPGDFNSLVTQVANLPGANVIPSGTLQLGSVNSPAINVNYGNLDLSGNNTGYGILVVTGVLTFKGNFVWNGIVLVIGQGDIEFSGGGGGTINGSVMVAKTNDSSGNQLSTLGTPTLNWTGGGGNGIFYDHCWADGLLNSLPITVPASASPLKILSVKSMSY